MSGGGIQRVEHTASTVPFELGQEQQDDGGLLELARTGDRAAYGELWLRYRTLAVSVARPFAHADAEDIASDAFEAIWDKLQQGDGPQGSFRGYLLATVRNLAARSHRKLGRVATGVDLQEEPIDDETGKIEHEEAVRDIRRAFEQLPERWRQVLWMLDVEGRPRAEVAVSLGLSPNSTTQLYRRAKEGLREAWLSARFALEPAKDDVKVAKDLPRYVRGGWTKVKRQHIREHLSECRACRARETELRQENAVFGIALALLPLVGGSVFATDLSLKAIAASNVGVLSRARERAKEVVFQGQGEPLRVAAMLVSGVVVVSVVAGLLQYTSATVPEAPADPPSQPTSEPAVPREVKEPAPDTESSTAPPGDDERPESDAAQTERAPAAGGGVEAGELAQTAPNIWPTVELSGPIDGSFAPVVRGAADPARTLMLAVSGIEIAVDVASDGAWSADLGSLGLTVGTHSVFVSQTRDHEVRRSPSVSFALTLPTVTRLQANDSTAGVAFNVAGVPGAQVCLFDDAGFSWQGQLDAAGSRDVVLQRPGAGAWQLSFRYCDATRVGPSGGVYVG